MSLSTGTEIDYKVYTGLQDMLVINITTIHVLFDPKSSQINKTQKQCIERVPFIYIQYFLF